MPLSGPRPSSHWHPSPTARLISSTLIARRSGQKRLNVHLARRGAIKVELISRAVGDGCQWDEGRGPDSGISHL